MFGSALSTWCVATIYVGPTRWLAVAYKNLRQCHGARFCPGRRISLRSAVYTLFCKKLEAEYKKFLDFFEDD